MHNPAADGSRIRSFRDLVVWQLGKSLAVAVYRATTAFPAAERFGLAAQMRRAAVSVPSNLAEGWARNHRREFANFAGISLGSLAELETQIEIAQECRILAPDVADRLLRDALRLRMLLLRLRTSLESGPRSAA
ncbi:MAG: four helix bundle protein [Planctomycetia bacterium]|nr:four helix bundle protein [Planctomycetia bacterium]